MAEQRDAPGPLLGEHGDARLLQELWESLPEGALLVGADGKVVMANATAERIFGYGQGELGGADVELLVPERSVTSTAGSGPGTLPPLAHA